MEIKQLEIAKTIPFADTNRNLKRFIVPDENRGNGSLWQLLMGARAAGLENDSLLDVFYDIMAEKYRSGQEYGVFLLKMRQAVQQCCAACLIYVYQYRFILSIIVRDQFQQFPGCLYREIICRRILRPFMQQRVGVAALGKHIS